MQTSKPENLMEIDSLVESFIDKHQQGIVTMHKMYLKSSNTVAVNAFLAELKNELRTGCVTFFNKNDDMEELDPYLFYIANAFFKKKAEPVNKKKTEYLCPGCLFLNKNTLVTVSGKYFKCNECESELQSSNDPKMIAFYRAFFNHSKNGYHCNDCDRFIPHPIDDSPTVSCPYFDCMFVGSLFSLKRMHHPTTYSNPEVLTLDAPSEKGATLKDRVASEEADPLTKMEIEEDLENKISLLQEAISSQRRTLGYNSSGFTINHKTCTLQAFENLIRKFPAEMVSYLLEESRSGGFQHKIFQEYIKLLEESLPISFKKNNKIYRVDSLLDENINLFDGISTFEASITDKLDIKNGTKEFYIGGRKAVYTKPFYIGKLLNVVEKHSKKSLIDYVKEYSFSKIKMKDVTPGIEVVVTHLRVPPHYQMGGMVYINRARKKIVERAKQDLKELNENNI